MKSNGNEFVKRTISSDSEDCEFLVDEKQLYGFLELCNAEFFDFTNDGNRIRISGNSQVTRIPTENAKSYLRIDSNQTDWIIIPKLALAAAGIASNFIFDTAFNGAMNYVFLGDHAVIGCDGNIGYRQEIKEDIPKIVLSKNICLCISKMATCEYSQNESYNFFKNEETIYGFLKTVVPFYPLAYIFIPPKGIDLENHLFSVHKNFFAKFCSYCNNRPDSTVQANFTTDGMYLKVELVDSKNEFDAHDKMPVNNCKGDLKFNPDFLNTLLKSIPCENVYLYEGLLKNMVFITDIEKTFTAAIMKIS